MEILFIRNGSPCICYGRRRRGPRPPGKPNIAVRAVGHVFQYWIIYHSLAPSTTPPQSAARRRLLICISSRSNFKRQHNIIIIYISYCLRRWMLRNTRQNVYLQVASHHLQRIYGIPIRCSKRP